MEIFIELKKMKNTLYILRSSDVIRQHINYINLSQNLLKCHINYKTNTLLGNRAPTCEFTLAEKNSGIPDVHF